MTKPETGGPVTVYVSIGNSDDKLTQASWGTFVATVRDCLRRYASAIHGEWFSAADSPWQNACFCAEFAGRNVNSKIELVKMRLDEVRHDFGQDSIAWAVAQTEFIAAGPHATEAPCFEKGHVHQ